MKGWKKKEIVALRHQNVACEWFPQAVMMMMTMTMTMAVVVVMMNNSALQENSDLPGSYGGGMAYVKARGAGKEIF